jgi:ribonuclease P protein component
MLHTLTKESDFKKVAKNGRPFFASEMAIKVLPNNLEYNRYGIVVNTKVDKRAVVRNKIQRRIRYIIRSWALVSNLRPQKNVSNAGRWSPDLRPDNKHSDILILTRPEIKKLDYKEIKEKLEGLFKKARLF